MAGLSEAARAHPAYRRALALAGCLVRRLHAAYDRWRRQWPNPFHYLSGMASAGRCSRSGWTITSPTTRASRSVPLRNGSRSQPGYDRLYALYENSRLSTREIEPFIRKYHINMAEFEPVRYRSFAEFFDRRFRPGVRKFPSAPEEMGAFAEARYFGWRNVEPGQKFPVKSHSSVPRRFLAALTGRALSPGPVLLVRLAPVDYHHMHYPDDGTTRDHQRLGRRLWTVNWHALQSKPDILFANERNVNILETHNFGRLGFVEVGALSVGRIAQVHPLHLPFRRGEETSVFRFGGSAIVVFGEAGKWSPSADLLEHTRHNVETLVRLELCRNC